MVIVCCDHREQTEYVKNNVGFQSPKKSLFMYDFPPLANVAFISAWLAELELDYLKMLL